MVSRGTTYVGGRAEISRRELGADFELGVLGGIQLAQHLKQRSVAHNQVFTMFRLPTPQ